MRPISNLLILCLCLLLCASDVFAQKKKKDEVPIIEVPGFPIDKETNLITYMEVVQVPGSKADLYKKGFAWFNSFYKNATNVIKESSEANGKIFGKPKFRLYLDDPTTGTNTHAGLMMYEISFQAKDGRYRYEITRLNWQKSSRFPAEKLISDNKAKYTYAYASYLVQTDKYMKDTIKNLKAALAATEKPKPKEW